MAARKSAAPTVAPENPRRVAGIARVQAARAHIQRALVELGYARSDLASVIGFPEIKLVKAIEALKDEFYGLADRIVRIDHKTHVGELDRDPARDDDNPHNNGCGQRNWKASY